MRYLSLFSGIEAATQAWQPFGWECVAVSEIEPFPCAVLEHHYPDVPNLGDVTKITEQQIKDLGQIDLVVFGSPCQNLSVAGNRKGLQGTQSGLFYDSIRIIQYAREHCGARFALWENVPGSFSSNKGADFAAVVEQMAGLTNVAVPKNGWGKEGAALGDNGLLEWSVLDAQWFGLAQRRKRVFAIVDFGDWASRPPILLERESLRGDSAPSREAREDITTDVGASTYREGGFGQFVETQAGGTVKASGGCLGGGSEKLTVFAEPSRARALDVLSANDPSPTLSAKMGTGGNNMPMVAQAVYSFDSLASNSMKSSNPHSGCRQVELAKCLDTSNGCPSKNQGGLAVVAIAGNIIGRTEGNGGNGNGFDESGACYTLTTNDRHAVAFAEPRRARGCDVIANNEPWPTLPAHAGTGGGNVPMIAFAANPTSVVRRLTPIECERLQGFPDNFTQIPYRNKSADDCPNGVRYKALGNSMAVNVMAWIGQRIELAATICY